MSQILPKQPIAEISGKMSSTSQTAFRTNTKSKKIFTQHIGDRDYAAHPVTDGERRTHAKMQQCVAEYKALKQDLDAWALFQQQYQTACQQGYEGNAYNFFLHERLNEGKNTLTIKIAKGHNSEASFVDAMHKCENDDQANALLLQFVDKIGYHALADAYRHRKWTTSSRARYILA